MVKLFAGNLSFKLTKEALQQVFAQYGEVVKAELVVHPEDGRSRGFGFVTMSSRTEAEDAVRDLNGKDVDGRKINVEISNSQPGDKPRRETRGDPRDGYAGAQRDRGDRRRR